MPMEDIRLEGKAGRLDAVMTAVVADGPSGKEYRLPTGDEMRVAGEAEKGIERVFGEIPFDVPNEPLPSKEALGFRVPLYGFDKWSKLFTPRQLFAIGPFVGYTRTVREQLLARSYSAYQAEAVVAFLSMMLDRLANQNSNVSRWNQGGEKVEGTFARFALPILWDFAEVNLLGDTTGGYLSAFDWVSLVIAHLTNAWTANSTATVVNRSATSPTTEEGLDLVLTDPPYYDAIPYSDLMDFFYVWLRRSVGDQPELAAAFAAPLAPKWDSDKNDGELIDDSSRFG